MGECIALNDRDYQTLALLLPNIFDKAFHVFPKTKSEINVPCITADDIRHEDVWFSRNFWRMDEIKHGTVDGRDDEHIEVEKGWAFERKAIYDKLTVHANFKGAHFFGAFYGVVRRGAGGTNQFIRAFREAVRSSNLPNDKWFSELIKKLPNPEALLKSLEKIELKANRAGDTATVKFTKVIKAAVNLYVKNNTNEADKILAPIIRDPRGLDDKQRAFLDYLRVDVNIASRAAAPAAAAVAPAPAAPAPVTATVASCAKTREILGTDGRCQSCARTTVFRVLEKNSDGSAARTECVAKAVRRRTEEPAVPTRKFGVRNFFQ